MSAGTLTTMMLHHKPGVQIPQAGERFRLRPRWIAGQEGHGQVACARRAVMAIEKLAETIGQFSIKITPILKQLAR